jgi:hypothetical protein
MIAVELSNITNLPIRESPADPIFKEHTSPGAMTFCLSSFHQSSTHITYTGLRYYKILYVSAALAFMHAASPLITKGDLSQAGNFYCV